MVHATYHSMNNANIHHFLVALIVLTCIIQFSVCSRSTRIVINDIIAGDDENCTRLENGTLVCNCGNGTDFPCWMDLIDSTPPTPTPAPGTCVDCPAGSYSNSSTSENCTLECVPGSCIFGTSCPLCSPGYFNPFSKQDGCAACNAGSSSEPGAEECTSCVPGYYADHPGTPICKPCPVGWVSSTNGSSSCNQCDAGKYSPKQGGTDCEDCDVGTYSDMGASQCSPCQAGYFNSKKGAANCTECPVGSVSHSDATSCIVCPLGTASNSDSCVACDSGSFANGPTNACTACPIGQYSPSNKNGITECSPCDPGSYASAEGSNRCIVCAAGTYTSQIGQHKCPACPAGSYCPDLGTITPKDCPKGFFCRSGSVSPSQCATLYHANSNSNKCIPSPSFYLIIMGSILAVLIVGLIAWRIRVSRRTEARRQNSQLEITRLIPKPRDGPVYSGW